MLCEERSASATSRPAEAASHRAGVRFRCFVRRVNRQVARPTEERSVLQTQHQRWKAVSQSFRRAGRAEGGEPSQLNWTPRTSRRRADVTWRPLCSLGRGQKRDARVLLRNGVRPVDAKRGARQRKRKVFAFGTSPPEEGRCLASGMREKNAWTGRGRTTQSPAPRLRAWRRTLCTSPPTMTKVSSVRCRHG